MPAYVTAVFDKEARIIVLTEDDGKATQTRGRIPFSLADWAYPPRRPDGVRPPPIRSLREALSKGDIIMVQRPEDVPDRLARLRKSLNLTMTSGR